MPWPEWEATWRWLLLKARRAPYYHGFIITNLESILLSAVDHLVFTAACVAQPVTRLISKLKVSGSNPGTDSKFSLLQNTLLIQGCVSVNLNHNLSMIYIKILKNSKNLDKL
jgi:hypothetical protein